MVRSRRPQIGGNSSNGSERISRNPDIAELVPTSLHTEHKSSISKWFGHNSGDLHVYSDAKDLTSDRAWDVKTESWQPVVGADWVYFGFSCAWLFFPD